MPFVKQYFSGGPYSVRAFRIRGLGPGTYTPAEGDLYLWPSFLDHGTTPHNNDKERIMLSFDIRFTGPNFKYGDNGYNG